MEDKKPSRDFTRYSVFTKPIAKSVNDLVKPIYKKHGFAEHRILTEWNAIVGKDLAAYSIPQKLTSSRSQEGGTLHILVASARALELQHLQPAIMDKIATYFGYRAVKSIRFTQTTSDIFRKSPKTKQIKKTQPSEAAAKIASECRDEELRNALLSLSTTLNIYLY
jgi:hypothetical protein